MVSETEREVKHIADIVGEWGKWQLQLFVYAFLICASGAFINMGYSFNAKSVDFWCSDVPQEYLPIQNITNELKCNKYSDPLEVCTEWTYNTTQFKRSIFTEFNLVCHRSNYASMSQSFFMLGYVASGLVISHYSDKYGRRPMVWVSYTIEVIGIISCGLSVNIFQFIISRFMVGFGHSGGGWAMHTILLECSGPKHRSDIVLLAGVGWVLGYVLLPGVAYWLQDFRYIQLISAIPMTMLLIWFWFFYESPRWQIINGKEEIAEQTIRRALEMNGKSTQYLKEDMKKLIENLQKTNKQGELEKSHNMLDLLRTPKIRKYTFIIWYSWIVNALIYYGFSFNMSDFGGNFYITFLLSGLVELPTQLITPLLLKLFGRRTLYAFFMFLLAFSSFAVIPSKAEWLKVTFALIGKYAVSTSWSIHSIQSSEIYPTIIRNTGLGVGSVVARIGSMSSPFMGNLATNTSLAFVMIFYGVLSLISGLLGLILPETKDREIPDTIEEIENFDSIEMKTIDIKPDLNI